MLIVMDKFTHEEHLDQPLETNKKQYKIAVTYLNGYNCIFNFTDKNRNFYFARSITDKDCFIEIPTPPDAFEIEPFR